LRPIAPLPTSTPRRTDAMTRLSRFPRLLALPVAIALAGCGAQAATPWTQSGNDVIVDPVGEGAANVRLQVVSDRIIRVTADPDGDFQRSKSLMRVEREGAPPKFEVTEGNGSVRVAAAGISAEVSLQDGRVAFFDAAGQPLVSEVAGGRSFEATQFDGTPYYSIRQRFESRGDEGLYGTGLHQQGWMNLKGRDVELLQHNIDNAIPYLTSSRNYGILWDNNSITRYGDPRGLRQIGEVVTLYDKDGVEGALTATYSIDGEVKLVRREEKIDYQFIS